MQIDAQPFQVGESKFIAISSPAPFGKSLVNKPDGTPLGGVAKVWDDKTKTSSEEATEHLGSNQFLMQNLAEYKPEWVKPLKAYVVRITEESKPVIAAVCKYLRDHAISPEPKAKAPKDTSAPVDTLIAQQKAAAQAEMAALLNLA